MSLLAEAPVSPFANVLINIFIFIVYNYASTIQLAVAVFMFCGRLPRRRLFAARVTAYIAVLLLASSFWGPIADADYPVWLIILRYFIIFGIATAGIMFMYRCPALLAMLCGTGAYALQHFMYRIQSAAVYIAGDALSSQLIQLIVTALIFVAVYAAMYLLFIRKKFRPDADACRKNLHIIIIDLIVVCIVVVISALFDKYSDPSDIMYIICTLYAVISCVCIFVIIFWLMRSDSLKADNRTLERMLQLKGEQLAASKQTIDIINVKCHDMKHQIAGLRKGVTDEGLDELERAIDIYDSSLKTGNGALDIVLAEKGLLCTDKHIRLSCVADGAVLGFLSDADVYSLFGNALDNAIRASEVLAEDKRVISVNIKQALGLICIHIENYYSGELSFEGGMPKTTQEDNGYHGFGIRSMHMIANKYGGYMNIDASDGVFRLDISFPVAQG